MRLLRSAFVAFLLVLVGTAAWGAPRPLQANPLRPLPAGTPGPHRFVMIGDGGTGDDVQRALVSRLRKTFAAKPFSHVLLLGDNVYLQGEEENFERALGEPYRPFVKDGVRLLVIPGNHDVFIDRGAPQIAYVGLGKKRWYQTKLADGKIDLFAIDSTLLVQDAYNYRSDEELAWQSQQAKRQVAWLDRALAASTAPYKLVMGHHPLYSSGSRAEERVQMRAALGDTLEKHGVTAYFAGHQHIYERRAPKQGVVHFVSGGGGRDPQVLKGRGRLPDVHHLENHFVEFELGDSGLAFQAVTDDGTVIDRGVLAPRP